MVAEMPIRVGESGKNKGATVAWMSGTGNKGRGYRSNVHCGGTRDIAAVWANTAEDD